MGAVVNFEHDNEVEFDGQAMAAVARLSQMAVEVHAIHEKLSAEGVALKASESLNRLIAVMNAIDETIDALEEIADRAVDEVGEGEEFFFSYCSESGSVMVKCRVKKRCHTLRVQAFSFTNIRAMRAPDNDWAIPWPTTRKSAKHL